MVCLGAVEVRAMIMPHQAIIRLADRFENTDDKALREELICVLKRFSYLSAQDRNLIDVTAAADALTALGRVDA
jgi:hypothetical protein